MSYQKELPSPLGRGQFVFRTNDCLTSLPQSAQFGELLQLNEKEPGEKEADQMAFPFSPSRPAPADGVQDFGFIYHLGLDPW